MTQNNISRLESPDYGKATITSLKRIADAFDVALMVRFVPFNQYIHWLSGTPFVDFGLRPESMAVQSFQKEENSREFADSIEVGLRGISFYFPVVAPAPLVVPPVIPAPLTHFELNGIYVNNSYQNNYQSIPYVEYRKSA